MEVHSVLPEERYRNAKGETLPWGYRYADSSKNARQPEESGPFGRNRSIRYTSSSVGRRTSTRASAGATPSRQQKENSAVNDFSRLFAKEQAARAEQGTLDAPTSDTSIQLEKKPTECLLYGYASKSVEWKVLSRFERIVAPGIICEDYDREDPNLYQNTQSPMGFNRSNITVRGNLSKEALAKARIYKGGNHWLKVTFDSYEAADRACFFSPIDIDGYSVHCVPWEGHGPMKDEALRSAVDSDGVVGGLVAPVTQSAAAKSKARTLGSRSSALAGFEQALNAGAGTLPRSHTLPAVQYAQPTAHDDLDLESSATASSATATTGLEVPEKQQSGLRSRSVPSLLPSQTPPDPTSAYMSRAPGVKRVTLRPISEALPPQQSLVERVLRSLPVVSWVLGLTAPAPAKAGDKKERGLIGEGPVVKDDGSWDTDANGWYWMFWWRVDGVLGTDFCGLKED